MDRTTTIGGNIPLDGDPTNAKIEGAAKTAHQTVEKVSDRAAAQIDRLSGTAHRAVNSTADAATSAAEWASTIPEQARQMQTQVTETARASIRAHPLYAVAGAVTIGYLIGRLARL